MTKEMEKRCGDCGETKHFLDFATRSGKNSHLLNTYCKPCMVKRSQAYKAKNKEATKAYLKTYMKSYNKRKK